LLRADTGLHTTLVEVAVAESITLPAIPNSQIVTANVGLDLADRAPAQRYPQVYVYCEKVTNRLTEKFRRFSGEASLIIDIRVSQDRVDGIEQMLQFYIDAITRVLENNRGEWNEGLFYSGAYEVTFGGVRQGGKNFIQSAKVSIDLDVSQD
jgi:hypothetical protein